MDNKKKIIFIGNDWFSLYNYRKELIQQLIKVGYDVYACIIDDSNNDKIKELGVKVIIVPMERRGLNPFKDLKTYNTYKKVFRTIKPDIAISYTIKPCIYGGWTARKYGIPFIATITGLGTSFQKGKVLEKLVTFMYKIALKKAKAVFFQNDENKQIFIDKKIILESQARRVNGSGVNLEKYNIQNYPNNKNVKFLYVGRIMKDKGLLELFQCIKRCYDINLNVEFCLVGKCSNEMMGMLNIYLKQYKIKYVDFTENVIYYYKKCDCLIMPSHFEGLCNVILEAGATGRPIISTNISGCKEAFDSNNGGYLVETKNSQDLFDKIKLFLSLNFEQRKQMGIFNRKIVEKKFDRGEIVTKYLQVINNILYSDY